MARPRSSARHSADALAPQADPRAPLDRVAFLSRATALVRELEADLLTRAADAGVRPRLVEAHKAEVKAERTGDGFEVWLRGFVTQAAVAWVLSAVFVRVLEDRGLVPQVRLAGPGAMDAQKAFFEIAPSLTERDYLRLTFRELELAPATAALFDAEHSPTHVLAPSAEGTKALLRAFREPSAEAPAFRFGHADTRFLGDLYQDLSESVRERYALLQTPDFIERYILRRTLDRAIERFGLDAATVIDPTCGSGHFLLGAFARLVDERSRREPNTMPSEIARRALDQVAGSDINPYAVAIARFRLTLAYLDVVGIEARSSDDAPPSVREGRRTGIVLREVSPPPLHLAVADALLFNPQKPQQELGQLPGQSIAVWYDPKASAKNDEETRDVLGKTYAAVVGNPPYITVKDPKLRERYRALYEHSAAGTYSLAAPFLERFFQLARPRGFVGTITSNSFMKREFGRKLIQDYLPTVNLDGVVNSATAYVPGHGTPTCMLFGTQEAPVSTDVLSVLAKEGEPSRPEDPAKGLVWSSIEQHSEEEGFENDFISVGRVSRATLKKHPWSLGGGGAAELKELLEQRCANVLAEVVEAPIGRAARMGADEVFMLPKHVATRIGGDCWRPAVIGEAVRDWATGELELAFFPYDESTQFEPMPPTAPALTPALRFLWPYRRVLEQRATFGGTVQSSGMNWYEYMQFTKSACRGALSIAYAEIGSHNHFVLDRGGKVFKQTAPIIKLRAGSREEEHLALLAYLNSSTAAFLMRQLCQNKGGQGINQGIKAGVWEQDLQRAGTAMSKLVLPPRMEALAEFGRQLDQDAKAGPTPERVALQEQLDFEVYRLFGLLDHVPSTVPVPPGRRRFEVDLARDPRTTWFRKNGYELPQPGDAGLSELDLPAEVVLLERPEFKRRWVMRDLEAESGAASRDTALDSLKHHEIHSANLLVRHAVRGLYDGIDLLRDGWTEENLPAEVPKEAVPYLAALRYSDTGLEKRAAWERTWALQRKEDAGTLTDDKKPIPVPPKYDPKDFRDAAFFRLRGKLDVPKERFISYPGCESDEDGEPVFGWAGWNHLQQAQALAALYEQRKKHEGWTGGPPSDDAGAPEHKLTPMLAGLLELLPWLHQWHDEPDEQFGGLRMGQYFDEYLAGELRIWGLTREDLAAWRPTTRRAASAKKAARTAAKAAAKKLAKTGAKAASKRREEVAGAKEERELATSYPNGHPSLEENG